MVKKYSSCKKYEQLIIEDLKIKIKPKIFYGTDAKDFIEEYGTRILGKNPNGAFLYQGIPDEYKNTGVVCIIKDSVATLAHELCHAKQYQDDTKWFNRGLYLKIFYFFRYYYYPTEIEAFTYAEMYLKKVELFKEAEEYSKLKRKLAIEYNLIYAFIFIILGLLYAFLLSKF
ncbi:hypothetical protein AAGS61_06020 [Lysinibacillus sp. KU-BSD001]|uniref:hypothetical protein n=1 Tax=Lysinibacillus sp. KU-BSD001 TaxID=3141328 RepID=UPI0036EABE67